MRQVVGFVFLLMWTLASTTVSFGKSTESVKNESITNPFEILYYETIPDVVVEALESQMKEDTSQSAQRSWLFDAFGKSFRVSLDPNTRLIAKLPAKKRLELEKQLKFFKGTLDGIPDSWVRLTRVDGQWSGMIWDGHEAYVIDPMTVIASALQTPPSPPLSGQAIYRFSDTKDLGIQTCGLGEPGGMPVLPLTEFGALIDELQGQVGITAQGATRNIDMSVVTDREFTIANTNPNLAVIARLNVVDGIFSEQLGVQISLVDVLALQNNGGLTSTDANTLLTQFSQFTASSTFHNPGVAHLFTGRNLDGSTVGIAYLRSLCSARFGIGVNQILGTGTAGALTVAHELGHNFGAPHDNQSGSPCASTPGTFLMNPFLNGSDQFSPCSISEIQPVIDSASCLTVINIEQADLQPHFQASAQNTSLGQSFSSVLSITNIGQGSAFNPRADFTIPNGLMLENIFTNSGSCNGNGTSQGTCIMNSIPPGAVRQITLTLKGLAVGSFTLQGRVSADNDVDITNNTAQATITIASPAPSMATPAPGSTLTSSTITFTGGHTTQDLEHWLYVGTSQGAKNLHNSGSMGTAHSRSVTGLPTAGTIYLRYWTRNSSGWGWRDHTYTMNVGGSAFPPFMATPTPGSTLTTATVTFTGGHTTQDLEHWLYVGTSQGAKNLHNSGSMGTAHSRSVTGLPSSGTIHVRYWTRNSSGWGWRDHTYTMNVGGSSTFPPLMGTPPPGSTLTSSTITFTGGHTTQDLEHWLYVGTSLGAKNLHNSGSMGTAHSRSVTGLPSSGTIHVRYWTRNSSGWEWRDHTYTMKTN